MKKGSSIRYRAHRSGRYRRKFRRFLGGGWPRFAALAAALLLLAGGTWWGVSALGRRGEASAPAVKVTPGAAATATPKPSPVARDIVDLTDGAKVELFVFDLSFIGWELLSSITCGILGILYVNPYIWTAHAGIYDTLKDAAIRSGKLTWEDFGQLPPPPPVSQGPVFPSYGF